MFFVIAFGCSGVIFLLSFAFKHRQRFASMQSKDNTEHANSLLFAQKGQAENLNFRFRELGVTIRPGNIFTRFFHKKKTLLKGISGEFRSGKVRSFISSPPFFFFMWSQILLGYSGIGDNGTKWKRENHTDECPFGQT
jgi:hypothetical protein